MLIPQPNNLTIWHFFPQLVFSSLITLLPVQPWTGMTLGSLTSSDSFSKDKHMSSLRELKNTYASNAEDNSQGGYFWSLVVSIAEFWWRPSSWLEDGCYLAISSHGRELWYLLIRTLIPSCRPHSMTSSESDHLPKAPPWNECHHIWGHSFNPLILGKHGCSFHSTGPLKFAVKGDDRYYTNDYKPSI